MSTITELESQALKLSAEDRVRLADRLLTSLAADGDVEEAWAHEVDRRLADLTTGSVTTVSVEDALARARKAMG